MRKATDPVGFFFLSLSSQTADISTVTAFFSFFKPSIFKKIAKSLITY